MTLTSQRQIRRGLRKEAEPEATESLRTETPGELDWGGESGLTGGEGEDLEVDWGGM